MTKAKKETVDSWGSRMKDWGGGDFTFLSSDGESLTFIIVGLPVLMESHYKGNVGERIGCPVVTDAGYQLYVCGKRVGRKLSKVEKHFKTNAIMVVRHGVEGDQNAKYAVKVLPEKETFEALVKIAESDFEPAMIEESIKAATEVMQK